VYWKQAREAKLCTNMFEKSVILTCSLGNVIYNLQITISLDLYRCCFTIGPFIELKFCSLVGLYCHCRLSLSLCHQGDICDIVRALKVRFSTAGLLRLLYEFFMLVGFRFSTVTR